jgi:hypothetical protein
MDLIIVFFSALIIFIFLTLIFKLDNYIKIDNDFMRLDIPNYMKEFSKIVMHENYIPTYDNDIVTKKYVESKLVSNDISNFLKTDKPNDMEVGGKIIMNSNNPSNDLELITKKYVDDLVIDASDINKGIIKLTGALSGTAESPDITNKFITLNKLSNLQNANQLIGSDNNNEITEYSLGNNIIFSNNNKIELINIATSVNGVRPDENGNVPISIGRVITGALSNIPDVNDESLSEGDIFIVSGDPDPNNDGETFIISTSPLKWNEVITNISSMDNRYVRKSGNNDMLGTSYIRMSNTYVENNMFDVTTKQYVDDKTKNATTSATGLIQLSGDLTGTAINPIIANNVITKNKMANLTSTNKLLGSNSISSSVTELMLGDNLYISGNVLNSNSVFTNNKLIYMLSNNSLDEITQNINSTTNSKISFGTTFNQIRKSDSDISVTKSLYDTPITINPGSSDKIIKLTYTIPNLLTYNTFMKFRTYGLYDLPTGGPRGSISNGNSSVSNNTTIVEYITIKTGSYIVITVRSFEQATDSLNLGNQGYLIIEEI